MVTVTTGLPGRPDRRLRLARQRPGHRTFAPPGNGLGRNGLPGDGAPIPPAARGGQTATGPSSPITVTGLTNGDFYSFTVTATNHIGTRPASLPSNPVTPPVIRRRRPPDRRSRRWPSSSGSARRHSRGLSINWQVTSSVIGLNDFAQNQVDFAASDIPYVAAVHHYPTQPYQYLPDVASGLAFMFNLNGTNGQRITNLVLNALAHRQDFPR